MRSLHTWTPTLESSSLSQLTGKKIFLKMESNQPAGSFKIRGIGRLCQHYYELGKRHFVAFSGGNAGLAVAYAGKKLGVKVTVFLPFTSKQIFIDALKGLGATVNVEHDKYEGVIAKAVDFAKDNNAAYIPPFDHPLIWAGHSTMIDEVVDEGIAPELVIASVGGGGLACGVLEGLINHGWDDVPLVGVETEGAASFAAALKAGKVVTLPDVNTIATSLAAKAITPKLLELSKVHPVKSLLVTDHASALACQKFLDDHRVFVEPSCGAALSVLYDFEKYPELHQYHSILVIVCGGVGISTELLADYLAINSFTAPIRAL